MSPVKDGGVSGAWDRLRYMRLCLYTTLTIVSFVRERVTQCLVRKWIRIMRQSCIVSHSLSDAFHERKRFRALSIKNSSFLAAVALTVSFLGKFLESMESFPTHTNVYSFMKFSINFRQKVLVGVSRWENYFVKLLCVYFFKETIFCVLCARGIYSLCIYSMFKLWMFLIIAVII